MNLIHPDFKQWEMGKIYPNGSKVYSKGKYFKRELDWWVEVYPNIKTPKGNIITNDL